jgi:hypothetical protein
MMPKKKLVNQSSESPLEKFPSDLSDSLYTEYVYSYGTYSGVTRYHKQIEHHKITTDILYKLSYLMYKI